MSDLPEELNVSQTITMTPSARQRLRSKALEYDLRHGPFARVLIAAALDLLDEDPAFAERITGDVNTELKRYTRS